MSSKFIIWGIFISEGHVANLFLKISSVSFLTLEVQHNDPYRMCLWSLEVKV